MTTYPSSPVDSLTADTLALIAGDPIHSRDRELIVRAVHAEAAENAGEIDPNRLRARLTGEHGLMVTPCMVGPTIQALCKAGVIRKAGYVITTGSTSGNSGRPAPCYVMTSSVEVAA